MLVDIFSAGPAGGRLTQSHNGFRLEVPISTTGTWQAQVRREWTAQVPEQVWSARPDVSLRLEPPRATIEVRAAGRAWALPAEECGSVPELPTGVGDWLAGGLLAEVWGPVLPCMGTDPSRPALCAVEVLVDNGGLLLTATDAYSLAQVRSITAETLPHGTWQVPAEAARWLAKRKDAWTWRRGMPGGTEATGASGWRLWADMSPALPDWRRITLAWQRSAEGREDTGNCTISAQQLASALKSVAVGKPFRTVRLVWSPGSELLLLEGRGQAGRGQSENPTATATVAAATSGSGRILLDTDRLRKMVAALGRVECTLRFASAEQPLALEAPGGYLGVLMCCRDVAE